MSEKYKDRKLYIDVLRIIAIFLVLFNHSEAFELYQDNNNIIITIISIIVSCISKASVPLFFMISGSLLLSKKEDYSEILKKRVKRIFILLLFFSFGLYIKYPLAELIKNHNFDVRLWLDFIPQFIEGKISRTTSYWFLYSYIGMLLMLPLIRYIAMHIAKKDIRYILIISFIVTTFIPLVNALFLFFGVNYNIVLSGNISLAIITSTSIVCPIYGYYFDNEYEYKKTNYIYLIVLLIINVFVVYIDGTNNGFSQNYIAISANYIAIYIFILTKSILMSKEIKNRRLIISVGSCVIGIYLLEPYMRWLIYDYIIAFLESIITSSFINSLIWCFICFFISYLITLLLKKLPILRKYLK